MVTSPTGESSEMLESFSSHDKMRLPCLANSQCQQYLESKLRNTIRAFLSSTGHERGHVATSNPATTEALRFQNSVRSIAPKRCRGGFFLSSTTRLFLAELRCFLTTYDASQHRDRKLDECSSLSRRQLKSSISFFFVPSKCLLDSKCLKLYDWNGITRELDAGRLASEFLNFESHSPHPTENTIWNKIMTDGV